MLELIEKEQAIALLILAIDDGWELDYALDRMDRQPVIKLDEDEFQIQDGKICTRWR